MLWDLNHGNPTSLVERAPVKIVKKQPQFRLLEGYRRRRNLLLQHGSPLKSNHLNHQFYSDQPNSCSRRTSLWHLHRMTSISRYRNLNVITNPFSKLIQKGRKSLDTPQSEDELPTKINIANLNINESKDTNNITSS